MNGKFNNSSNIVSNSYCFIIFPLILIGGAIISAENGLNIAIGVFLVVILVLVSILLLSLLKKCEFSADDEKIVFRVVFPFLKYTYYFSEIKSASTQVGFSTVDTVPPPLWNLLLHYLMGSVLHSMMKMFPMKR